MRPARAERAARPHNPVRGGLPLKRSSSSGHRSRRVAEEVRQIAASFLAGGARDPRIIGLVTVTRVDVTTDLSRAVIHYTVHGDADVQAKTAEGLAHAASAVRREVARSLKLRIVPEIVFAADAGHQHASRIEELLAQLRRESEAAGGESPAGDHTDGESTDGGGAEGEVGGEG